MNRAIKKLSKTIEALAPVLFCAALAAGFVLAGYQVWRTARNETPGRRITLDFLWPTYTPQKVPMENTSPSGTWKNIPMYT